MKYFQQALVIAKEVGNKTQEGTTLNNIGAVYNSTKQYPHAEKRLLAAIQVWESLRQGLTDADKISIFDKQAHTYNFLQHALIAQNKTKTALEIAERGRARAFVELLSKRLSSQSTEQLTITPPKYQQLQQIAREQKATLIQYSIIYTPIKVHEKEEFRECRLFIWVIPPTGRIIFRWVDLKPLLQQNTTLTQLAPNSPSFVPTVPNSPTHQTPNTPKPEQKINTSWSQAGTIILLIAIGSSVIRLVIYCGRFVLTKKATTHIKLKQHLFVPSLLILSAVSASSGLIFLMTQSQPLVQKRNFEKPASLEQLVSSIHQDLGTSRGLGIVPKGQKTNQENRLKQLHTYLIKPIADLLPTNPNDRIIFVPQSSLFLVPFPALQDESGKYLIEKHTILTAPSIQVLELTRKQKQRVGTKGLASLQSQDTLIVGNPKMPSVPPQIGESPQQLPSLPGAEQEAKVIANLLKTQAIIGDQATKISVVRKMSNARIVHLATHGLLDERRGLDSAIALTPDPPSSQEGEKTTSPLLQRELRENNGLLTADEILDLKLNAELVVLSACDTGKGKITGIADPDLDYPDGLNSTLVPFDSTRPAISLSNVIVQDIMGHTLFLLMSALKTENVTFVLDCCYSGGAKRGNLQVRAINGGSQFQASPQEIAYQQQWLSRLNLSPAEFKQRRRSGVAKGVVITATNRDQLAADCPFYGFSAGAFTYLMSQYFWQQTGFESIFNSLPNIARSTTQISFTMQTPEFEAKPGSGNEQKPIYFTEKLPASAEAVITKVNGDEVELWLGGIESQSLAAFNKDAIFAGVDTCDKASFRVQLLSRQGLVAKGKLLDVAQSKLIQPGALCTEQVRGIPDNLSLRIGLDLSLGKDIAQAKASLQAIKRIAVLPLQQGEIDYIFGRMNDKSLGLFSPGMDAIPDSFGSVGEKVTDALLRLQAKFKSLLAARIVKMMLNTDSSRLKVTASLIRVDQGNQVIAQVFPTRALGHLTASVRGVANRSNFFKLPVKTPVQLQITNNESRTLYLCVLVIDSSGEMTIIFPHQWIAAGESAGLEAGKTLLIPEPNRDSFNLQTQEPLGMTEILIIASVTPLRSSLKVLQAIGQSPRFAIAKRKNQEHGPVALSTPIEVIENLLADLARSSANQSSSATVLKDPIRRVDTTQLAAMSIAFEVS